MNEPTAIFENNDKAAHAVSSFIRGLGQSYRHLILRPFNRFDTAYTEWWIIPASEWPAYRYSKLCFHRRPHSANGVLYAGYCVEKSLSQCLSGMPGVQAKHIMRDDWYWHEFVSNAIGRSIKKTAREVGVNAQTSVRVLIEIHEFNKVPEPDTERSGPSDSIEFTIEFPNLEWALVQKSRGVLSVLNDSTGISQLVKLVDTMSDLDFYWIDWVIGIRLRYGKDASQGWKASDIWSRVLEPWLPWVR